LAFQLKKTKKDLHVVDPVNNFTRKTRSNRENFKSSREEEGGGGGEIEEIMKR
jgi:hypothetical protein